MFTGKRTHVSDHVLVYILTDIEKKVAKPREVFCGEIKAESWECDFMK